MNAGSTTLGTLFHTPAREMEAQNSSWDVHSGGPCCSEGSWWGQGSSSCSAESPRCRNHLAEANLLLLERRGHSQPCSGLCCPLDAHPERIMPSAVPWWEALPWTMSGPIPAEDVQRCSGRALPAESHRREPQQSQWKSLHPSAAAAATRASFRVGVMESSTSAVRRGPSHTSGCFFTKPPRRAM